MTSKNFALITAMTQAELTQKVNEHLAKGWHLQGETRVAYEPGTPWYLMQAMVADGTTDISPDSPSTAACRSGITWWYLLVNPMPWLTVKGFRFRILTMRPTHALNNWPVATQ